MTTESIIGLVVLAFALSLDNFRSSDRARHGARSVSAGPCRSPWCSGSGTPSRRSSAASSGSYFGDEIGPVAEYVGPVLMGAYGLYLLVGALRNPEPEKVDHPWVTLFGMPLALSVDNLLAGTGLGLLGFSPVIPALVFGVVTAVMSLVGLFVGRAAARVIPIRSDLLSGVSLLTAAIVLPIVFA